MLSDSWWSGAVVEGSVYKFVIKSEFHGDECRYSVLLSDLTQCWYESVSSQQVIEDRVKEMNPSLEIIVDKFLTHLQTALQNKVELVSYNVNKLSNMTKLVFKFSIGNCIALKYYFNLQQDKDNQEQLREHLFLPVLNLSNHLLSVCKMLTEEINIKNQQLEVYKRTNKQASQKLDGDSEMHRSLELLEKLEPDSSRHPQDAGEQFAGTGFNHILCGNSLGAYLVNKLKGNQPTDIDRVNTLQHMKDHMVSGYMKGGKRSTADSSNSKPTAAEQSVPTTSTLSPSEGAKDAGEHTDPEQRMKELRRKLAEEEGRKKKKAKVLKL